MYSCYSSGNVSIPRCPVTFDGFNYRFRVTHMRRHMQDQCLWEFLTGEMPCPPRPTQPVVTNLSADAYDDAMKKFHSQYADAAYRTWNDEDARASCILVASMEIRLTGGIVGLPSAEVMWTYLRERYEPTCDFLYMDVLRQERSLQQGDDTVDEFYGKLSAIWSQIDSLGPDVCHTCHCCQHRRSQLEFRRVYDFLTRLGAEFEHILSQLLTRRPRVTLLEILDAVRTEEARLRGVLAGQRKHCTYCDKDGHLTQVCYKKKKDTARRASRHLKDSGVSFSSSSQEASTGVDAQELLMLLRRMTAIVESESASSIAESSNSERPSPTTPHSSGAM